MRFNFADDPAHHGLFFSWTRTRRDNQSKAKIVYMYSNAVFSTDPEKQHQLTFAAGKPYDPSATGAFILCHI